MSLLPRSRRRSCHVLDVSLATFQMSLLPRSRRRSCHVLDVSLATFQMSLLPRSRRRSCHILDVSLAMFQTSLLPRSRRRSCHLQDAAITTKSMSSEKRRHVKRRLRGSVVCRSLDNIKWQLSRTCRRNLTQMY
jgi:hypothetical protein